VLNRYMIALLGLACAFFLAAEPAFAQKGANAGGIGAFGAPNVPPGSLIDAPANTAITRDNTSGSRLHRQREEERRQTERRRRAQNGEAVAPDAATPSQVLSAARSVADSASLDCRMTEASHPGVNADEAPIYEAVCADGPGYLLIGSTPPQAYNCLELAGSAATARMQDPTAEVGYQCELPANQNSVAVIGDWARQAGVTCRVDQAVAIGKSVESNLIYEVGCADAPGYWIEKVGDDWRLQTCEQIATTGETCRFTAARN